MSLSELIRRISSILLPEYCVLCMLPSQQAYPICTACCQDLPKITDSCSLFKHNDLPFSQIYSLFPYQYPITRLIIALKFRHQLTIARAMGILMAEKVMNEWYVNTALPQLILPIPLHAQRLRERGFNQALEIAKPLSHIINLPIDSHSLFRSRATLAQSGLSATQRIENMKGAFSANSTLNGLHVAVIDDVVTTGHTMTAACIALKEAGVRQIDVWCCART